MMGRRAEWDCWEVRELVSEGNRLRRWQKNSRAGPFSHYSARSWLCEWTANAPKIERQGQTQGRDFVHVYTGVPLKCCRFLSRTLQ